MDYINLVSSLEKKRYTKKDRIITAVQIPLTGIMIGFVVTMFIYLASKIISISNYLINYNNLIFVIVLAIVFIVAIFTTYTNYKYKGYIGNGISILSMDYYGNNDFNPYRLLFFTTINSYLAFFFGFTLGTEAPSVTIGASVAKIGNKALNKYDRDIVMAGGSSGFAAAFIAPIAGFIHLLEVHKHRIRKAFIIKGIFMIIMSYISSYILQRLIWNRELFYSMDIIWIPFNLFYAVILVSILSFGIGELFSYVHGMAQRLRGGRLMLYLTPILALGFFLLKKYYPLLSGNGDMAIDLSILDKGLFIILLIMITRFIFMILSENANVSGGTVLPLIALGAILGEIIVSIISKNDPSILKYENTFKAIGMFCCLGCAANIPITSYVLAIETLHTYQILLSLGIALIFIVFLKKMINLPFAYKKHYRIELDDRSIV